MGMIKVHSDRFCWSKETQAGMLIAQLEMGDFLAAKKVSSCFVYPFSVNILFIYLFVYLFIYFYLSSETYMVFSVSCRRYIQIIKKN